METDPALEDSMGMEVGTEPALATESGTEKVPGTERAMVTRRDVVEARSVALDTGTAWAKVTNGEAGPDIAKKRS